MTNPNAFPVTETERGLDALLRETLALDASRTIWRAERLAEDLGCDSLDHVELMFAVEEAYDVVIDDDAAENIKTVGELCAAVAALTAPNVADQPSAKTETAA